jgi:SAM-dependent methyltransferase
MQQTKPDAATDQARGGQAWANEAVTTPDTTRPGQMAKIFGYMKGLHATHLMDIGREMGLFERLAAKPEGMRPEILAGESELHPPYVRQWCETACALELLDYDPMYGYRLAPFMDGLLGRPDATYYVGGFAGNHLLVARDYARYPELFRSGATYPYGAHDETLLRAVPQGTSALPRMFMDAVMPRLPGLQETLSIGARVLDVGCGAGHALVEFATRFPTIRCVGIDVDAVAVGLANTLIAERGLCGRVGVQQVDSAMWPDDFAGQFDLVTTFLVLHEIRPDLKDEVLGQCVRALAPGGRLLLFDERYPSRPGELRDPVALFAVMAQWYELTWGNVIDTREDIHARLARQGMRIVDETSLSRFYIVTAEKAQQTQA